MENWKTIEGFEYEVSNLGKIRSLDRMTHCSRGSQLRLWKGRIIKPSVVNKKYLSVHLFKSGKSYTRLVHRLVAQAFLPNPLGLPEVNHKGKTTDNRDFRLEWISTKDHGRDKAKREQGGDGVHFVRANRRERRRTSVWGATYQPEPGKTKHIGYFVTYKEAKAARDEKMKTL